MNPQQVGSTSLGLTGAGAGLQAFGSLSSGMANSSMYSYQAAIARLNADADTRNAHYSTAVGENQNEAEGLKQRQQMGKIITAQASSGFDMNSGSAVAVRESQQGLDRLSQQTIRQNAARTAYNYETQAAGATAQAQAYDNASSNSMTAGIMGFGSSIIGGAASVSSQWLQGQRAGLWGGKSFSDTLFGNA
jgi:hypothetical protein